MSMRDEFESWYASKNDGFCPTPYDGEYDFADAQMCWEAWQAARAQGAEPVAEGSPLPCPFCGSQDVGGTSGVVSCYRCNAQIEVQNTNTAYAVELWNQRAYTQPQSAGVPETATEEMLDEGVTALIRGFRAFPGNYTQVVSNIWEDMRAAATTPRLMGGSVLSWDTRKARLSGIGTPIKA